MCYTSRLCKLGRNVTDVKFYSWTNVLIFHFKTRSSSYGTVYSVCWNKRSSFLLSLKRNKLCAVALSEVSFPRKPASLLDLISLHYVSVSFGPVGLLTLSPLTVAELADFLFAVTPWMYSSVTGFLWYRSKHDVSQAGSAVLTWFILFISHFTVYFRSWCWTLTTFESL